MKKPTTIIQGMQNIQLKYLIYTFIVCFTLNAFLRKYLIGINESFDIVLGSLPNFIAVFVISVVLTNRKKVVGIYKHIIIIVITSLFIFEEYYPTFTGNKVFDSYDIIASVLGGLFAIILTLFFNRIKTKH